MNKLRLTNVIENHFYLDFNWKDGCADLSVSRRVSKPKTRFSSRDTDRCADSYVSRKVSGPKTRFSSRDTDRIGKWSVSWQRKEKEDRNRDLGSEEMR